MKGQRKASPDNSVNPYISNEKLEEFRALFSEFEREYINSYEGKKHQAFYSKNRDEAKINFQMIIDADQQGQDITDLVLLKLLPYADTKENHQKGAWVHIAPAINGDLRKWFESIGWTRPEEWTNVAKAVLIFTNRCIEDPKQLAGACKEFVSYKYTKGFQTGMLTPILNALRPQDFVLINNKPRKVINYLLDETYSPGLMSYPEINRAALNMLDLLSPAIHQVIESDHSAGDLFDIFSHWLVAVKKFHFKGTTYWKIAPGENGHFWNTCKDGGYIAMGWDEVGDISGLSRKEFNTRWVEAGKGERGWTMTSANQAWKFAHIKEGDKIIANRGTTEVLGIGTVNGDYYFVPNEEYGHRLPVEWYDTNIREVMENGWRRTVIELSEDKFRAIEFIAPKPKQKVRLTGIAKESGFEEEGLNRWINAIERKGQAIIYGPPGTGKTYIAEQLAQYIVSGGDGFVEVLQFHPAYTYEEFIQGIRPQSRLDGGLEYPMKNGRFLDFCARAQSIKGKCVLILDEINRANLARVFGELMYLLEYRNKIIPLAAGDYFQIPSNVRIIGTMNTADRSIALVDHALRRRFAFIPLFPNYAILKKFHQSQNNGLDLDKLISVLNKLNKQIADPHYQIGITFFLVQDLASHLRDIWQMEIEPYIEEYFFDRRNITDNFRWENIVSEILP